MKDAGMRIRLEPELRDEFIRICKTKDLSAAQVIRAFMREFIEGSLTDNQKNQTSTIDVYKKITQERT